MIQSIQMTNREFGEALPRGNVSLLVRHAVNGIEWWSSFNGIRTDHYDTTPTTPQDAANMLRANGGAQDWIAMPVWIRLPDGRWVDFGYVPRMHGSFVAGGKPGAPFQNHSNVPPAGGWKANGGHCCCYAINSTGGTTAATTLPAANNRKARALANQRAVTMNARGAMSRAACHEANLRSSTPATPPAQLPPETINFMVEITGSTVNIRSEPSTARGNASVVETTRAGERFSVDRRQEGPDHTAPSGRAMWYRVNGGPHNGRWFAERLSRQITTPPPTPQPAPGTLSIQVVAARDSVYIDTRIARLRGMGYANAFRTKSVNGWYQARVPAGTEAQARNLLPVLVDKGFKDAFIVRN